MASRPRLLVTGGSGFLGRHLLAHPELERWEVAAPSSGELDLRDGDAVATLVRAWRPTAVVHTAYRKDERDSIVAASGHVARAAADAGARLVHLSSDALFAGRAEPYTEADRPSPVFDYGRDKADAETEVAAAHPSAVLVRTSLIYGSDRSDPSVHETTVRRAIDGEVDLAFFTDEVRSPVLVDDLAGAVLDLVHHPEVTGVVNLGGPEPLSRAELATLSARRHGWDADRLRFTTLEASGLSRPGHVVLDSDPARSLGFGVRGPTAWA